GRHFRPPDDSRRRHRLRAKWHRRSRRPEIAHVRIAGIRRLRMAPRHHSIPEAARDPPHRARAKKENNRYRAANVRERFVIHERISKAPARELETHARRIHPNTAAIAPHARLQKRAVPSGSGRAPAPHSLRISRAALAPAPPAHS